MLPELASPTARPPALLHGAPCGAHILQRHEHTDVAASCRFALTRLQPHAAAVARACKRKLVACSFCCAALCGADP